MSCEDIPSLLDLQKVKKHADDFGRLMGTGTGTSTNEVTGQIRPTYNAVMKNLGFKPGSGDFTTGFTVMPSEFDVAWYDPVSKNWYSYLGVIPSPSGHPVAPGTTPVGDANWAPRTDELLRSQLLSKRVYAIDFGRVTSDAAVNTMTIQLAIDYVFAAGGGIVDLGPYKWLVDASPLNETYDNYGVPVAANTCCVVLRKGVSLIGQPGRTKLYTTNRSATLIYMIAPVGNVVSGFEIDGGWNPGDTGGNNGIFQLGTTGGDTSCDRVIFSDLNIHNVASYGLALQNGNPRGCNIARVRVDNIGADGLDLKARGSASTPAQANSASDVWVSRYNQRVDGSAGVDVRGIWHLRGITVTDFGGDPTRTYVGIRFRTKPAPIDPQQVADKTTLTGFIIRPTIGSAALNIAGIECGSDDTHINNGYVEDCHHGVIHTGNVNGSAIRGTVTDVTSVNARQYGFRNAAGTQGIKYVGCEDVGAVTAGFRIEGDNCTAVGCAGTLSVTAGALPTFIQSGGRHGASYVVTERQNDTTVAVSAKGTAADITIRVNAKGTGHCSMVGDIRPEAANTRYVGSGSLPYAGGFTQAAFTITSDEHYKTQPLDITDAMLDAAAEVDWVQYQYLDRVEAKGEDGARWHFGAVAQRFVEAFQRHELDPFRFAFICYDEWEATGDVLDEETGEILIAGIEAGSRYGIRYEEALALEAALQRRNYQRLLSRIEALEAK